MRNELAVFDALRTFARSATRRELENETGLDKRAVENGLRTLAHRRPALVCVECTGPRERALYSIAPDAERPAEQRGKYVRDEDTRALNAASKRLHWERQRNGGIVHTHKAASAASHAAAPGAARIVVKGILETRKPAAGGYSPCTLSQVWKFR